MHFSSSSCGMERLPSRVHSVSESLSFMHSGFGPPVPMLVGSGARAAGKGAIAMCRSSALLVRGWCVAGGDLSQRSRQFENENTVQSSVAEM